MHAKHSMYILIAFVFVVGAIGSYNFVTMTSEENVAGQAQRSASTNGIPQGVECDFTAGTVPFNQGLLDYKIYSDASNPDTDNKVTMSRRFSMVDKGLASQYLLLNDFGDKKLNQVVFSMFEYYACMLPDWLYEKLEGLYLAKYLDITTDDGGVTRASVMVLKTREDAIYVAQLLLALSTDDLEFKWVDGNYVAYTAQKAYWWTHDNMIIRIAHHDVRGPDTTDAQRQQQLEDFAICETLDVVGEMIPAKCIKDQFWEEVPTDILNAYLAKLPSDGDEVPWPEQGQLGEVASEIEWPSENEVEEHQWGCDPERSAEINKAFASMNDAFSGDKDAQRAKTLSRLDDKVKISAASTDKRWYYLGEPVTFSASTVSLDEDVGTVWVDVNDNIFPHPEITTLRMEKLRCGPRETYQEKLTGMKQPEKPQAPEVPDTSGLPQRGGRHR
ncbi:MAG: hypothetical protein GXP63_00835 [DPANN group archaeon]|nr:hypothetical protein [DPANN group archaeon]